MEARLSVRLSVSRINGEAGAFFRAFDGTDRLSAFLHRLWRQVLTRSGSCERCSMEELPVDAARLAGENVKR